MNPATLREKNTKVKHLYVLYCTDAGTPLVPGHRNQSREENSTCTREFTSAVKKMEIIKAQTRSVPLI